MNHVQWTTMFVLLTTLSLKAQIAIQQFNEPYVQTFDSLSNTDASSDLPEGWALLESDDNADGLYAVGTGSSSSGNTYSFGDLDSTDRALGELTSGSLQSTFGVQFENNTGTAITSLSIGYTGEQWRRGNAASDVLNFEYSLDATSLSNGSWMDYSDLDFVSPNNVGSSGALDGNDSANQSTLNATIAGLSIGDGSGFWLRWMASDVGGSDHGLAIDQFSLTAVPETEAWTALTGMVLLGIGVYRKVRINSQRKALERHR